MYSLDLEKHLSTVVGHGWVGTRVDVLRFGEDVMVQNEEVLRADGYIHTSNL